MEQLDLRKTHALPLDLLGERLGRSRVLCGRDLRRVRACTLARLLLPLLLLLLLSLALEPLAIRVSLLLVLLCQLIDAFFLLLGLLLFLLLLGLGIKVQIWRTAKPPARVLTIAFSCARRFISVASEPMTAGGLTLLAIQSCANVTIWKTISLPFCFCASAWMALVSFVTSLAVRPRVGCWIVKIGYAIAGYVLGNLFCRWSVPDSKEDIPASQCRKNTSVPSLTSTTLPRRTTLTCQSRLHRFQPSRTVLEFPSRSVGYWGHEMRDPQVRRTPAI